MVDSSSAGERLGLLPRVSFLARRESRQSECARCLKRSSLASDYESAVIPRKMFIFVKFRFFNETISPKLRLYRHRWIERCRSLHPPEGERRGWRRLPRFYFPLVFSN